MKPIRIALLAFATTLIAVFAPFATAQPWPSKPVKVIAVFPAGGSVDQVARVLAQQMSIQSGQSFIVDNRGGASGSIGTAAVAKSDPDGYTLGVVFDTHAVNPSLIANMPFDTPQGPDAADAGWAPAAWRSSPTSPNPTSRSRTSSLRPRPSREASPTAPSASGRLRAIAVTSIKPDPSLPGVEPIAAQGVPGFEAYTWWGVFGPGNMPAPLSKRIYDELARAVKAPAVREKLVAQGIDVSGAPGEQLDAFVRKEMVRWAKVIKDNSIKSGD